MAVEVSREKVADTLLGGYAPLARLARVTLKSAWRGQVKGIPLAASTCL